MKKAQTEIIGLMVIVILFIFGGMIYIMFAGKGETGSLTRDVTQVGKVQNMQDTFMQITPCYAEKPVEQMSDLIKKCYTGTETICGIECKEYITDTLNSLIKAYNPKQDYIFSVKGPNDEEFINTGECEPTADRRAATPERILAGKEVLIVKLMYCTK